MKKLFNNHLLVLDKWLATIIGSKENSHNIQNDQMEKVNKEWAIPKTSSKISSEISNPSSREMDRWITKNRNKVNYEKIIRNCGLYAIDENYREAIAHAIKLLVFDVERFQRVKIGDIDIPVEIVERGLKRLNFFMAEGTCCKQFSKI